MLQKGNLKHKFVDRGTPSQHIGDHPCHRDSKSQNKKTVNAIELKKKEKTQCKNCSKLHREKCNKVKGKKKCNNCTKSKESEFTISNHTDAECWDLHENLIPAHFKEKFLARKSTSTDPNTTETIGAVVTQVQDETAQDNILRSLRKTQRSPQYIGHQQRRPSSKT